jgi:hypothetical protein
MPLEWKEGVAASMGVLASFYSEFSQPFYSFVFG